jgi:hypothetical protein
MMAKVMDPETGRVVQDGRADSTVDTLAQIAAEEVAEQVEQEADAAAAQAQEAASVAADLTHEWRGALEMARELLVSVVPPLDPVWSPPRLDKLAAALARCDQEYGWGGTGAVLGHPLFGLAVAGAPLGWGTYQVVKPMMDAAKAKKLEQERAKLKPGSMTQEQLAMVPGAPAFGS